jgi:tRNA modification GTPase
MTGPDVLSILQQIFVSPSDTKFPDRKAVYGSVIDAHTGQVLDHGLVTIMRGPFSYTGEDVGELSLHGSPVVLDTVVRLIISLGARLASRGEFTRRAFLAGKLDLVQAEAVIELIEAKTPRAAAEARLRMDKSPSAAVKEVSDALTEILADLEAHIDFDEDEESDVPEIKWSLSEIVSKIELMRKGAEVARIRTEGIVAVIIGKPNVGKSSLFNALLKNDRTIVTPYPGTTRDAVDDCLVIGGTVFVLWDTAGIREHNDPVEQEGIRRTRERIDQADLVIAVLDASEPTDDQDTVVLESCRDKATVLALNKVDLVEEDALNLSALGDGFAACAAVSAKTGEGIETLEAILNDMAQEMLAQHSTSGETGLNARCFQLIEAARIPIEQVLDRLNRSDSIPAEILSYELRCALGFLQEITGERADEEILDRIFQRFCVGK